MNAICYKNTITTLPNWSPRSKLEEVLPLGFAYEENGYFIYIYGQNRGLYTLSPGITVIEKKKDETLKQWVKRVFGAEMIVGMKSEVGQTTKSIWRPGLYFFDELEQGLDFNIYEKQEEDALLLIFQKIIKIFLYISPNEKHNNVYSHYLRELLLLSCTEFENQCISILRSWGQKTIGKYYSTQDYV